MKNVQQLGADVWLEDVLKRTAPTPDRIRNNADEHFAQFLPGPVAQLVERCIRIAEASGSNPLRSTKKTAFRGGLFVLRIPIWRRRTR